MKNTDFFHLTQFTEHSQLLTQENTLLSAKYCYFSDDYSPRLKLEDVISYDVFITSDYMENSSESKEEWRRFFKMLGVKEGISPIIFDRMNRSTLVQFHQFKSDYFEEEDKWFQPLQTNFNADEYLNLSTLNFLEKTSDFLLSKLFWLDTINNISLIEFNSMATAFWGRPGFEGRNSGNKVANYTKWFIKNNSCIPTLMETCCKANDVFINSKDIIEIAGNYLPVFHGTDLSADWRSFFNFKTKLELPDYLQLLQNIVSDKTEKGTTKVENNERIQLIYEWFLDSCVNFNEEEIAFVNKWSIEAYLPDKKGNIFECKKLSYFLDGDAAIFQEDFPFLFLNASNQKHKSLETFLRLFSVGVLRQSEFTLESSGAQELSNLKNRLITILPYLIKWLEKTAQDNPLDRIAGLKNKVENVKIFSSESLEITYKNDWSKIVQVHFDADNLFVTNPWNSNKVMINLSEQLCLYLGIKGYEKELDFLLRVDDTQEINDYFSQEGITLPQSHENISFSELTVTLNQLTLTPEILASAGITTQAELEERLNDPAFASMFTHVSTSSFSMLEYALQKIERAKKNILAHLNNLPEYDCSNVEELCNSILGGIEKNGEEIFIVTRPSDNNEVIIYYQAEFDTLEYAESELWYENDRDVPEKLTLGRILKVTGFNRIPV